MAKNYLIFVVICLMLTFFLSIAYSAEEELIGYWTFDDAKADKAKDSLKIGNDGIIKGKAQWVQGKTGNAILFVKQDATYIEVIDNPSLNIKEQITMCAWIKPTSIYIGGDWKERNCVMAKRRAYYLDINEQGNLASYLYGVLPQEWLSGTTDMRKYIGKWVHVTTTYDGKEHKLFVDGKLDASVKKSGQISQVTESFYIGWVDNNRYFDGIIDEVMLWSKALTADDLARTLSVNPKLKLASCWGILKTQTP